MTGLLPSGRPSSHKKIPGPMQIGLGIEQGSKAAPYEYMKRLILPFGVLAKGSFISS